METVLTVAREIGNVTVFGQPFVKIRRGLGFVFDDQDPHR